MRLFKKPEVGLTPVGQITDVKVEDKFLSLHCANAEIRVEAISPEIVRVRALR